MNCNRLYLPASRSEWTSTIAPMVIRPVSQSEWGHEGHSRRCNLRGAHLRQEDGERRGERQQADDEPQCAAVALLRLAHRCCKARQQRPPQPAALLAEGGIGCHACVGGSNLVLVPRTSLSFESTRLVNPAPPGHQLRQDARVAVGAGRATK